jgi:hypothetical protein
MNKPDADAGPTPTEQPRTADERRKLNLGQTHWNMQGSPDDGPAPRQPNERDESADSQAAAAPAITPQGALAHADEVGPQVDTDKGPVLDAVYNRTLTRR